MNEKSVEFFSFLAPLRLCVRCFHILFRAKSRFTAAAPHESEARGAYCKHPRHTSQKRILGDTFLYGLRMFSRGLTAAAAFASPLHFPQKELIMVASFKPRVEMLEDRLALSTVGDVSPTLVAPDSVGKIPAPVFVASWSVVVTITNQAVQLTVAPTPVERPAAEQVPVDDNGILVAGTHESADQNGDLTLTNTDRLGAGQLYP